MPSSRSVKPSLLIVGLSGRALARSAQRTGLACAVIDGFADLDTLAACEQALAIGWNDHGFDGVELLQAADRLDPEQCYAVVYGAGFEARPDLLEQLCRRRALLGNRPDSVLQVKQAELLATLLQHLDIPHPETLVPARAQPPGDLWLQKRSGACGGGHVRRAEAAVGERDVYWQRFVPGRSYSATFLADGRRAAIVGYCEQWCEPFPGKPFGYGGAVCLAARELPALVRRELPAALDRLSAAVGLRGLNCVDFIADSAAWWLLEVNPRPGFTFDLHEHGNSLLAAHLAALTGQLPPPGPVSVPNCRAHALVYAYNQMTMPSSWQWPDWVFDRPKPGTIINRQQPICTVFAESRERGSTLALLRQRHTTIVSLLESCQQN